MESGKVEKQYIQGMLGIKPADFQRVFSFIDFANVNHWFDGDTRDLNGEVLLADQKVTIDLEKLRDFLRCFSQDIRYYYGHDSLNPRSLSFNTAAKKIFGNSRVFTKRIQKVRHYLEKEDLDNNTRAVHADREGDYVFIPKCNFDVEISVDAMRLMNNYDTICLLSSDADFAALLRYLKARGKKVILIKGGRIDASLGKLADLKINAGQIRAYIAQVKQKPGSHRAFADS